MSLQVENLEHNMAKVTIEVEAAKLDDAIKQAFNKKKGQFNVPGFRKGKVPFQLIAKEYGVEIFYEDAANILIPDAYAEAMKDTDLEIVSRPEIDVTQLEKGKDFIFTATFALKPEVTLGDYKGIEVPKTRVTVKKDEIEEELKKVVLETPNKVIAKMEELRVADAITEIFTLFKRCNKYIDETMPWALAKDEAKKERLATVLYNLVESISVGATLLESFMPETSDKVLAQLGAQKRKLSQMDTFGLYPSGNKVTEKPEILFARMDINEVMAKVAELHPAKEEVKEEEKGIDIEPKEEITFEEFGKMQFQVGEIISCEAVKKSKKLLCSQVKIGSQVKQIVSGIKAHYTPEEMVGKKVMVLVNLKPAKLAGVLSEGMLLCAEDENGELSLMVPEKKMPSGAEIC